MLNNLGRVTPLEMSLIVKDMINFYEDQDKVTVLRLLYGPMLTSMDMNGISITVLKVDKEHKEEILAYIDMPVDSPAWPKVINLEKYEYEENILKKHIPRHGPNYDSDEDRPEDFSLKDDSDAKMLRKSAETALGAIIENEAVLTKYDRDVEDGGLGTRATRAAKAV